MADIWTNTESNDANDDSFGAFEESKPIDDANGHAIPVEQPEQREQPIGDAAAPPLMDLLDFGGGGTTDGDILDAAGPPPLVALQSTVLSGDLGGGDIATDDAYDFFSHIPVNTTEATSAGAAVDYSNENSDWITPTVAEDIQSSDVTRNHDFFGDGVVNSTVTLPVDDEDDKDGNKDMFLVEDPPETATTAEPTLDTPVEETNTLDDNKTAAEDVGDRNIDTTESVTEQISAVDSADAAVVVNENQSTLTPADPAIKQEDVGFVSDSGASLVDSDNVLVADALEKDVSSTLDVGEEPVTDPFSEAIQPLENNNGSNGFDEHDESFGDFGTAAPSVSTDTGDVALDSADADEAKDVFDSHVNENEALPRPQSQDDIHAMKDDFDDDDFGDFDGEVAAPAPAPSTVEDPDGTAPTVASTPDEFVGTNTDVDAATATTQPFGTTEAEVDDDDDDDDFGDFEAPAVTSGTASVQDGEDDDFGAFDEASPPVASSTVAANAPNSSADIEDDDDFGDFDETPTTTTAASGMDAASLDVLPTQSLQDPILERLRSDFPKLFASYSSTESADESSTLDDAVEDVPSIETVLHELVNMTTEKQTSDGWSSRLLDQLFHDSSSSTAEPVSTDDVPLSSPTQIVAENAAGPFDHFSYPVGGVQFAGKHAFPMDSPNAAALFPVHVLSSDEPPRHVKPPASTKAFTSTGTSKPAATAGVSAPKVNDTSTTAGVGSTKAVDSKETKAQQPPQGMSEQAKNFLQRIPDLSYMLSSRLSLPTKK